MRVVLIIGAALFIATPAWAGCTTGSIGDNSPGAMDRYLSCRDMERRIETLEEQQRAATAEQRTREEEAARERAGLLLLQRLNRERDEERARTDAGNREFERQQRKSDEEHRKFMNGAKELADPGFPDQSPHRMPCRFLGDPVC